MGKVMTTSMVGWFWDQSRRLSADCIQWTVAGLHWVAHLGLRLCDCVCDGLAQSAAKRRQ